MFADGQVVEGFAAGVEAPAEAGAGGWAADHRGRRQAEHGQQGRVAGGEPCGDTCFHHRHHRAGDTVVAIHIAHRDRAIGSETAVGFGHRPCGVVPEHQAELRRVVDRADADGGAVLDSAEGGAATIDACIQAAAGTAAALIPGTESEAAAAVGIRIRYKAQAVAGSQ